MARVALAAALLVVMIGMSGWGLHTLEKNTDILLSEMRICRAGGGGRQ
jgi:hypothetical protein